MVSKPASAVAGTAAFSKFMDVLERVAEAEQPPGVAELARASGYPRPTVYRIVSALLEHGLISQRREGGAYELGPRLLSLASRSWSRFDLRVALEPELRALRDATGETVHMAVPSEGAMIYVEKIESPGPLRMVSRVGGRLSLHSSAVGKAYLAALPEQECEALLDRLPMPGFMPNTITTQPAMRAELQRVREQGYAVDNEENEAGIVCYGVVLCDSGGNPVAGVSVSTLLFRQQRDPRAAYVEPLLRLQAAAARTLYAGPVQAGAGKMP
ncbi:MAG TPA: IclR family transcriptional regulator [Bordetella sp.]